MVGITGKGPAFGICGHKLRRVNVVAHQEKGRLFVKVKVRGVTFIAKGYAHPFRSHSKRGADAADAKKFSRFYAGIFQDLIDRSPEALPFILQDKALVSKVCKIYLGILASRDALSL